MSQYTTRETHKRTSSTIRTPGRLLVTLDTGLLSTKTSPRQAFMADLISCRVAARSRVSKLLRSQVRLACGSQIRR